MFLIIYHRADNDGRCCGAICKYALETLKGATDVEYRGVDHEDEDLDRLPDLSKDKIVIMCDFSLEEDLMLEIADKAKKFIWIDHHETAKTLISPLRDHSNVIVSFVEGIGACYSTWNTLVPNKPVPRAVEYMGYWDVWRQDELEGCEDFQNGTELLDMGIDSSIWEDFFDDKAGLVDTVVEKGKVVKKSQEKRNEKVSKSISFVTEFGGYRALCCNSPGNSKLFDSVYDPELHDILVTFRYDGNSWLYTIYVPEDKDIDGSLISKKYGGGGHKAASGFSSDKFLLGG